MSSPTESKPSLVSRIRRFPAALWSWVKTHKFQALLLILLIIGVGAYINAKRPKPPVYTFTKPERRNLVKTLDVSGVVDAKEKARLRFIAGGKTTFVGAQEGDAVKKWQTIATIDQASLQKGLEKTLNLYSKERLDWEDTRDDIKDDTLNTTQLRAVNRNQLDLNNTVLDVEIQDIAIQNTRLTAPFAGILTHSPLATAGIQLLSTDYFEVVNPNTMLFRAEVDEADVSLVNLDQPAKITLDSYPDETFESRVNFIGYTSEQTTSGTVFLIELPLGNVLLGDSAMQSASSSANATRIRLGMNGEATLTLATKDDVLSIPVDVTRERDGKYFVDVKTGEHTVAEREITLGMQTDEYAEVLSGLSESDEVVVP